MDFTIKKYLQLLNQLKDQNYTFITYSDYCAGTRPERFVILRHDVDLKPFNSLEIAKAEKQIGVKASYYFRAVPESWNESVIKEISQMGFEVGYHYESLATCSGDMESAYSDFCENLERLRALTEVRTICMHGSPLSSYDNKDLWERYDFRTLGILGEAFLTTDFSKTLYLTDTGRRWDGYKVSIRDKIEKWQAKWITKGWSFHATDDIILALDEKRLPNQLMITTHPQRWTDSRLEWTKELLLQTTKNIVKRFVVRGSAKVNKQ